MAAHIVHLGQDQARKTDSDGLCHVRLTAKRQLSYVHG
jgi:hypothetical protein